MLRLDLWKLDPWLFLDRVELGSIRAASLGHQELVDEKTFFAEVVEGGNEAVWIPAKDHHEEPDGEIMFDLFWDVWPNCDADQLVLYLRSAIDYRRGSGPETPEKGQVVWKKLRTTLPCNSDDECEQIVTAALNHLYPRS